MKVKAERGSGDIIYSFFTHNSVSRGYRRTVAEVTNEVTHRIFNRLIFRQIVLNA